VKFHHVAIMVSDLDVALQLWINVLDFEVVIRTQIPTPDFSADGRISAHVLDDIFGVSGARSEMALLRSAGGAMVELQRPENPDIVATPKEHLRYGHTGIHEVAFLVDDAQMWFERVRAAGYKTQTDYVWPWTSSGMSFLFYDADGNLIQLNQQGWGVGTPSWRPDPSG
jgi:catechol 2,3-dioxygenase-like lactoylglutathione lyase family enzyme